MSLEINLCARCGKARVPNAKFGTCTCQIGSAAKEMNAVKELLVKDTLTQGLTSDGAQHKQWALWRVARLLHIDMSDVQADEGTTP